MVLIPWIGCSENDFEENSQLKASLQGTWNVVGGPSKLAQVTFDDHTASWYDSTVNMFDALEGEIQVVRGECSVKFTINDGSIGYKYNGTKETDVLWVFFNDGKNATIVNYSIKNGVVGDAQVSRASTPVPPGHFNTSFVIFSGDRRSLEFCTGNGLIVPVSCTPFIKVN